MSPTVVLEADALVAEWLREDPTIVAFDANVAGALPGSLTKPWVRVTQLDGRRIARAKRYRYMDYMLQFDCYASSAAMRDEVGQGEASEIAGAVFAFLADLPDTERDGAVVSRTHVTGPMHLPDTDFEPARERYVVSADILMRPV